MQRRRLELTSNIPPSRKQPPKKLKAPKLSREQMQEIRNQEAKKIPLSETYTYDVNGFPYHEDRSMAGVFFFDSSDNNPSFNYLRPYPYLGLPPPTFFSIPAPFTICSSSSGLLLCRDLPTNTYYVFNPFVDTPDSYRHIPGPTWAHQPGTPSVLTVDLRDPAEPIFHIICMVHEGDGYYTFDTYSSDDDNIWYHDENGVTIGTGRHIITRSGIGNGEGMAFWLTSVPHQVVRYRMDGEHDFAKLIDVPVGLYPWATLQLGRLNDAGIGLVVSCRADVRLFLHRWNSWQEHGSWNVRRENDEVTAGGGGGGGGMEVVCRGQMQSPELMRFEREVPLFTGERMVVWDLINEHRSELRGRLHEIPTWTRMPPIVGDSVPYVTSKLVAAKFRVAEVEEDEEGDEDLMGEEN